MVNLNDLVDIFFHVRTNVSDFPDCINGFYTVV